MRKTYFLVIGLMLLLALSVSGFVSAQEDNGKPWIGIVITDSEDGVQVRQVAPDSPAEAAGIEAADIITSLNGEAVETVDDLISQLANFKPEDTVTLGIIRDGTEQEIEVTLGTAPERGQGGAFGQNMPPGVIQSVPFASRMVLGVQYHSLDETFAQNLGLDISEGALVTDVLPDSAAEKAGLQPGDIVTKVDEIPVDAEHTLSDILADFEAGDTVTLTVRRAGVQQTFEVTLEEVEAPFQMMPFTPNQGMPMRPDDLPFFFEGGNGAPFNFEFGDELGQLFEDLRDQLPTNGEPFTITCTDSDGNTVFSFSFDGNFNPDFVIPRGEGRDGRLNFDEWKCEVQRGKPAPQGSSGTDA